MFIFRFKNTTIPQTSILICFAPHNNKSMDCLQMNIIN